MWSALGLAASTTVLHSMIGIFASSWEVQEDWKKMENMNIVKISTHLCEVEFLQKNHNLVHQIGQHVGIERLVLSCFMKFSWGMMWLN